MFGIDFSDPANSPIVVFIGLLIGQLFLYGRKVKSNIKIASRELLGDLMQFGTQFAGAMGLLVIGRGMGWHLDGVWQIVTITILFTMTFDEWFTRMRQAFSERMGAAADALLGKAPTDGVVRVPAGTGVPATLEATLLNDTISDAELLDELNRRGITLMELLTKAKMPVPEGPLLSDQKCLNDLRERAGIPPVEGDEQELIGKLDEIPGVRDAYDPPPKSD